MAMWLFSCSREAALSRCQPLPVSTAGYELEWDTGLTTPQLSDACMNFHPNPSWFWNVAIIKTNPEVICFGCFGFSCLLLSLDCLEYPDMVVVTSRILLILLEPPAWRLECAPIWGHLWWLRKCCWRGCRVDGFIFNLRFHMNGIWSTLNSVNRL